MIAEGKVEIRRKTRKGEPSALPVRGMPGDQVYPGDAVLVDGRELPKKEPARVYLAYHKPRGVVCTMNRDIAGNLADAVNYPVRVSYAGRLDRDSSGLMILTNDGSLSDNMMRASSCHEKEYFVTAGEPVTDEFLDKMGRGVRIRVDDEETLRRHPEGLYVTTRPCKVRRRGDRSFSITLTQGYNRQIRRMCAVLDVKVTSIRRVRVLNIRLGSLPEGGIRKLTPEELAGLRSELEKAGNRSGSPRNKVRK